MLASTEDVKRRLPAGVEIDGAYALGLLEEASVLVEGVIGRSFDCGNVPDAVRVVTARAAARVILAEEDEAPVMAESVTGQAGPFSQTFRYSSGASGGGPWLTAADRAVLARFRHRRGVIRSIELR